MAEPVMRSELERGLAGLGVRPGDIIIAHASLSQFGYVVGGAFTLCLALRDALGTTGTLVMPGFTPQLCHPTSWRPSRLAGADPARLAREMPCFDPDATPVAATMGVVPECLRGMPGTARSTHPHTSFLAQGPLSSTVAATHPLEYRLSSHSPLGRLWELDAKVLMLGVSWSKCTALHLAEYSTVYPGRRRGLWPVPVSAGEETQWRPTEELLVWEGDFDRIGADFEASSPRTLARARIGAADCLLVSLREAVRFAASWLARHRDLRPYANPPGWSDIEEATAPLPVPRLEELLP